MSHKESIPALRNTPKRGSHNRLQFDVKPIIKAYLAGESELSISKRTGLERIVIRRRLLENGIAIRSGSEANRIRMSRFSKEERCALTQNSHAAAKAIPQRQRTEMLEKTAKAKIKRIGQGEDEIIQYFFDADIPIERQAAIGIYNIDILCGTIAVELRKLPGSGQERRRFSERTKYLSERGFTLIIIEFSRLEQLLRNANEVIALIKQSYCLPAPSRKHRVIRCGSNRFTRVRNNLGQLTAIPTPEGHSLLNFRRSN